MPATRSSHGRLLVDNWNTDSTTGKILRGHRGKVLRAKPTMYANNHSSFTLLVEGPRPFSNLAARKTELLAGLKARRETFDTHSAMGHHTQRHTA